MRSVLKLRFTAGSKGVKGDTGDPSAPGSVGLLQLNSAVYANQAEAEAGTDDEKLMTPLTTAQEIAAKLPNTAAGRGILAAADASAQRVLLELGDIATLDMADEASAIAGAVNDEGMSPLRAAQATKENVFPTRAALLARSLPAVQVSVWTSGYATAGDGGGARHKLVGSAPAHDLWFETPDGRIWEIDEPEPNEKQAGAAADNATNDAAALGRLFAWAAIDPKRRTVRVNGRCYSATDIPALHTIRAVGPGSVRVGAGLEYFVDPDDRSRGYGGLGFNTLYIDPVAGSNSNSGLAPEFAFLTPQEAFDKVLFKYGSPLPGYWRIYLAQGVYRTGINTWSMEGLRSRPLEIIGPTVSTWDNTAAPPEPRTITAITAANPPVVTSAAHGLSNGTQVFIGLATKSGGAHESDGAIYTIANVTTDTFELQGVTGSGWSAYTGGGRALALTGSMPKAVFYGTGVGAGWAFNVDGNDNVTISDVVGMNWGTKANAGDEGVVRISTMSQARTQNVHAYYCSKGVEIRDGSIGSALGGRHMECYEAFKGLHARYTFGWANPSTATRTDTPILKNNTYGVDIWEMASGHADGMIFIDNTSDITVRKNSHCVAIFNRFTNTGAAKAGITVVEGGYLGYQESSDVWTGSFRPRVSRTSYASVGSNNFARTWQSIVRNQHSAWTGGSGEQTVHSVVIPQGRMNAAGEGLRSKLYFAGTWANGNLVVRYKANGVAFHTVTLAANASAREVKLEWEGCQNGFGAVRGVRTMGAFTSPSTFAFETRAATPTMDTSAGAVTFDLTVEVVNAADSVSAFGYHELEALF